MVVHQMKEEDGIFSVCPGHSTVLKGLHTVEDYLAYVSSASAHAEPVFLADGLIGWKWKDGEMILVVKLEFDGQGP
jgi:hypothetical protein